MLPPIIYVNVIRKLLKSFCAEDSYVLKDYVEILFFCENLIKLHVESNIISLMKLKYFDFGCGKFLFTHL